MAKFTLDCSKLIKTMRKVQGDVFISMFDEWGDPENEFESELNKLGIQIQEDED